MYTNGYYGKTCLSLDKMTDKTSQCELNWVSVINKFTNY